MFDILPNLHAQILNNGEKKYKMKDLDRNSQVSPAKQSTFLAKNVTCRDQTICNRLSVHNRMRGRPQQPDNR